MSEELKKGDVVELKSGGFKMTVEDVGEGIVSCLWVDKHTDEIQRGEFDIETLSKK